MENWELNIPGISGTRISFVSWFHYSNDDDDDDDEMIALVEEYYRGGNGLVEQIIVS